MDNKLRGIIKHIRITKESALNTIGMCQFCILLVYILQPILYIALSHAFYGKIKYFLSGLIQTYSPSYFLWHRPLIFGCCWLLFLLLAIYGIINRPQKIKISKQPTIEFIKSRMEFVLFGLLFVWITFAMFFSRDFLRSRDEYIYYICYAILFVSLLLVETKYKRWLLEAFLWVGTIISLLAMFKDGFGLPGPVSFIEPESAIFVNRNYYGYYVAIITAILAAKLYKEKNIWLQVCYGVAFAINEFALLITLTRGAFLGVLVALVVMLIVFPIQEKKVSYKLGLIPAIFIAVFLVLEYSSITDFNGRISLLITDILKFLRIGNIPQEEADSIGSGRIRIWKEIIRIIKSSPIVGVGIDNTVGPHNEFLQLAAYSGIPALILYVAALATMYIKLLLKRAQLTNVQLIGTIGAVAYTVSSFFGNGMSPTIPFYIIVLAFAMSYEKPQKLCENKEEGGVDLASKEANLAINEQPASDNPHPFFNNFTKI